MTEAYPLQWPNGRPRTQWPDRSRFGERTIDQVTKMLLTEINRLGATLPVISTNLRLRNDGLPYSKQAQPADKGVAVYFFYKKRDMCFACDRWDRIEDNIYAITMTIEALRGIERWGSGSMVEQAFTGFTSLPAPEHWSEILGIKPDATLPEIRAAFAAKAKKHHPDVGGSVADFHKLSEAYNKAVEAKGGGYV